MRHIGSLCKLIDCLKTVEFFTLKTSPCKKGSNVDSKKFTLSVQCLQWLLFFNILNIAISKLPCKLACKCGIVEANFNAMTSSIRILAYPSDEIKTIETSAQDCFYSTHNHAQPANWANTTVRTQFSKQFFISFPYILFLSSCSRIILYHCMGEVNVQKMHSHQSSEHAHQWRFF